MDHAAAEVNIWVQYNISHVQLKCNYVQPWRAILFVGDVYS